MNITFWGVRGSIPSPLTPAVLKKRLANIIEQFLEAGYSQINEIESFVRGLPPHLSGGYGGNTPCIEVKTAKTQMIIDGGSGLRQLGYAMMGGPCGKGQGEAHLFFTHFHWDHLVGLPFFTPIFIPGNTIHVYAVQPELPEIFKTVFRKPYFPLNLEQLGAKIVYHQLEPRKAFQLGELKITPYQLDHPDPCWGYRIEGDGKNLAYCVDSEAIRVSRADLGPDLPLYQNVDLMVFDAQYTLLETIEKVNWGHAAASLGIDIAFRENIKRVAFMHHEPSSSDERIAESASQARRYYDVQMKQAKRSGVEFTEIDWCFATEGLTLEV